MKLYFDLKRWVKNYIALSEKNQYPRLKKKEDYYSIGLIDQAICSRNLGDDIISASVAKELKNIFDFSCISHFPGQINSSIDYTRLLKDQDLIFVGGTNLLKSNMDKNPQWKINRYSKKFLKNRFILMGVGWFQYEQVPNRYTIDLLNRVLSHDFIHSVRDSYTEKKLHDIGISNVLNTSCPSLWRINDELCSEINVNKSDNVITTLTSYNPDANADREILNILSQNYEKVYLWLQGHEDYQYFRKLEVNNRNVSIVAPSVKAYEDILDRDDVEYIGSRLHGGIKALQNKKRMLILAVDNRAMEISKDTNLNVIKRSETEKIESYIHKPFCTKINLPLGNIKRWKSQFLN